MSNVTPSPIHVHILKSLDELLRRDERRKEDGFPKKIRLGRYVKPSRLQGASPKNYGDAPKRLA